MKVVKIEKNRWDAGLAALGDRGIRGALVLGGQEFFVDNLCVYEGEPPVECDYLSDNESQAPGTAWGSAYGNTPGDHIFTEDGIDVYLDANGNGQLDRVGAVVDSVIDGALAEGVLDVIPDLGVPVVNGALAAALGDRGYRIVSGGTGPHYYQEIYASPHAAGRVYQADVRLHVTHDGGATFAPAVILNPLALVDEAKTEALKPRMSEAGPPPGPSDPSPPHARAQHRGAASRAHRGC